MSLPSGSGYAIVGKAELACLSANLPASFFTDEETLKAHGC